MSQDPFALLKAEVDLLGRLLGEAIRTLSGERFFALVEEVRALAKARRQGDEAAGEALLARVEGLSTEEAEALVRAFTHYFHLVNLAEERHRVRVNRLRAQAETLESPRPEGFLALAKALKERGLSLEEAARRLSTYPARYLGLKDRGEIAPGKRADLLVLGEDLRVEAVYLGGRRVAR